MFSFFHLLPVSAQQAESEVKDELKTSLIIGCDINYPPMSYINSSGPAGFDIKLIEEMTALGSFSAEVEPIVWTLVFEKLLAGEIHAASGIIRTEIRSELFDFSIPYLTESYAVFTHADSGISSIAELKGKKLAILEGDAIIETFVVPCGLDENMIIAASSFTALQLVASRDADFTIAPYSMGIRAKDVLKLEELKPAERALLTVEYRFAVRKGESGHLFLLNEAINQLILSGDIDSVYNESGFSRQFSLSSKEKHSPFFVLIIVIVVLIGGFYHVFNQRAGQSRTEQIESKKKFLELVIESMPMQISWKSSDLKFKGCNSRCRDDGGPSPDIDASETLVLGNGRSSISYIKSENPDAQEWTRNTCLPLFGDQDEVVGVLGISEDCSEQRRLSASIEKISAELVLMETVLVQHQITDADSGLFNYEYIKKKMIAENELFYAHGQKYSIILIDISGNEKDSPSCDKMSDSDMIRNVAFCIRKYLRHSDISCRIGSRKILIIMPKTNLTEAERVVEKLPENIEIAEAIKSCNCRAFECPPGSNEELPPEVRSLADFNQEISR